MAKGGEHRAKLAGATVGRARWSTRGAAAGRSSPHPAAWGEALRYELPLASSLQVSSYGGANSPQSVRARSLVGELPWRRELHGSPLCNIPLFAKFNCMLQACIFYISDVEE